VNAADVGPVPGAERTQSGLDLFLIFAGANIVTTTLVTGSSLVPAFGTREALVLIGLGSVVGAALVAVLAPVGPRLGVPSVVAARAVFGTRGAALLALLLYFTNFAWIALNNVIAGSALAQVAGGARTGRAWGLVLGVAATAIVAFGPRAVGWANRVAVPVMVAVGAVLLVACLRLPAPVLSAEGSGGMGWLRGFDVVVGYQVSWIMMFADYSRYTRPGARTAAAVFLGLGLTSLWFMPLGALAARAAGSADPGSILAGLGLGGLGALLVALGTVTTNLVNIYLSGLAWRSLFPRTGPAVSVWSIGLIGSVLALFSGGFLDRYADFMLVLGGLLVPVGGVLLARFFVAREAVDVAALYEDAGRYAGLRPAGLGAWALGVGAYYASSSAGGTLPALAVAVGAYLALDRLGARPRFTGPTQGP
jgi:nucleobase:cation symporter-1, NCS1 family